MKRLISLFACGLLFSGCAHVVSSEMRAAADKETPLNEIFLNPEAYKGRTIIIGGTIASSLNTEEGTYIEVVEKPLDVLGRPEDSDLSLGRFMILHSGYIDTAIYERSRKITVAGEVMGAITRPLGEIDYRYPLIKSKELNLVRPGQRFPLFFEIGIGTSF